MHPTLDPKVSIEVKVFFSWKVVVFLLSIDHEGLPSLYFQVVAYAFSRSKKIAIRCFLFLFFDEGFSNEGVDLTLMFHSFSVFCQFGDFLNILIL